jgi:hypothetical protein
LQHEAAAVKHGITMIRNKLLSGALVLLMTMSSNAARIDFLFNGEIRTNEGSVLPISGKLFCGGYQGHYSYDKIGTPIELNGESLFDNTLFLVEGKKQSPSGAFILRWEKPGLLGFWTNFDKYHSATIRTNSVLDMEGPITGDDGKKFQIFRRPDGSYDEIFSIVIEGGISSDLSRAPRCSSAYGIQYFWVTKKANQYEVTWRVYEPGQAGLEYYCRKKFDLDGSLVEVKISNPSESQDYIDAGPEACEYAR